MNAQVHTAASGEKTIHSFLNTHLALGYLQNMKVAYLLRTMQMARSHNSKWRKVQPLIFNATSCVRMLTKYESNLPTENK